MNCPPPLKKKPYTVKYYRLLRCAIASNHVRANPAYVLVATARVRTIQCTGSAGTLAPLLKVIAVILLK